MTQVEKAFDAFLSHSHSDSEWVEELACRLTDDCDFQIWLDKWVLVPGKSWQQAMARGLDDASACAVCIGDRTPFGWFQEEIERALDMQTRNQEFRVIPVLLPDAKTENIPDFLSLRTWADFRVGQNTDYAFHVIKQGIKGEPIGRWPLTEDDPPDNALKKYEQKILELGKLRTLGLHDEIVIEFERKILDKWLDDGASR